MLDHSCMLSLYYDDTSMINYMRFIGSFIRRGQQVGAVCPSSKSLARAMIKALGEMEPGKVIVELGPGTGVFTQELVKAYPNNRIIAIEYTDEFIEPLRKRFPGVSIVQGCASQVHQHLADHGVTNDEVGGLISGLPLLSMPKKIREDIFARIAEVVPEDRLYVQFTYSKRTYLTYDIPRMKLEPTKRVLCNLPPACVLPYRRIAV